MAMAQTSDKVRRERSCEEPDRTPPTVGKSGQLGTRAERPCEGRDRSDDAPPPEPSGRIKAPAETPHSRAS
jgi:hypothetical protein